MLYNIIIAPIERIVDWTFLFITKQFSSVGVFGALIGVSLVINFLALPLYNIADALQDKERRIAKKLEPRIKRIKKAFKGDEQFMMLSTYYRQNNYHPLYVLRSSLSILIEIPFFIAAYHYLSNCETLAGASFWIFKDLGSPDNLFTIHLGSVNLAVNVLPILMTVINFVSGAIYTKKATVKEKVQLYIIGLIFLVLLYTSPSGLVLYWILNNIFSLVKNIVMGFIQSSRQKKEGEQIKTKDFGNVKYDFSLLLTSCLALAVLCGVLLPSSIIASSPLEFSFLGETSNPLSYVWSTFCFFAGLFVFWPVCIYKMFGHKTKSVMPGLFFVIFLCVIVNVFVLKADYGDLNVLFILEDQEKLLASKLSVLLSFIFIVLFVGIFIVCKKFKKTNSLAILTASLCLAEGVFSIIKITHINSEFSEFAKIHKVDTPSVKEIAPEYHLSKNGKNVVVLFIDRAIGNYVPDIFNEFPDIKDKFNGFTYYPNTVSFSTATVTGSPAMMGGYEYSPVNINNRSDELLRLKNDEANLVMAKLFSDAGFESVICDPPWCDYRSHSDFVNLKSVPEVTAKKLEGNYYYNYLIEKNSETQSSIDKVCRSAIVNFCMLESVPPLIRRQFYRLCKNSASSDSYGRNFYLQFSNLYYMSKLTAFDSDKDSFVFIENQTPHDVYLTLEDDYETVSKTDWADYSQKHYQANVAVYKQVSKWLDYLRENNAYDNTRIILVSDHGRDIDIPCHDVNVARYGALLMVKDFNSHGEVKIDNQFMTNADTIFLAKEGLPVSDINPFTGNKLVQDKENGVTVYECMEFNAENLRNDKVFKLDESKAYHVKTNIYEKENWIPLSEWNE